MRHVIAIIERVSRAAIAVAFLVLMGAVLLQVFGRTFGDSPVWTEELTRYAMLYLAAFGAGLSFRNGDLVNVDIVSESLPGNWPRRMRMIAALATAFLSAMLILPAWTYTSIGALQTAPALGWRMDFIHVSMFVLLSSLLIFSLTRVAAMLTGVSNGLPPRKADDET